ncbi:MAG TPA: hypothetical protein VGQ83_24265 [Polyangia bacterium]|jgi:hypothetical protein
MSRLLRLGCLLALLAACDGAAPGGEFPLTLSWTFADGRGCGDAGVLVVAVGPAGATPRRFDCAAGLAAPLDAGQQPAGPLVVEALTPGGLPAYRAVVTMPEGPAAIAAKLVYVGGAPLP